MIPAYNPLEQHQGNCTHSELRRSERSTPVFRLCSCLVGTTTPILPNRRSTSELLRTSFRASLAVLDDRRPDLPLENLRFVEPTRGVEGPIKYR